MTEVPDKQTQGKCSDWYAWHDHEPPGPATLKVTGKCEVPRTSYRVQLRRAEEQGPDPKNLLLERIVTEVEEGWAVGERGEPLVATREARYEEKTDFEYETVTILPDSVTVPVEDVALTD